MQHTLPCSAIAKKAKRHIICPFIFFSKGQSCTGTYLGTYNAMSTKKPVFETEKVHTAPFSFGTTGGFSI